MSKFDDAAMAAYEAIGYSIPYEMVEDAVRAALKVLRDPDEAIHSALWEESVVGYTPDPADHDKVWQNGIDAVLAE